MMNYCNTQKKIFSKVEHDDQHNWTDDELKQVRHYRTEFVLDICKESGESLNLTAIKDNILSVQRGFGCMWNICLKLLTGPVLACEKKD